MRKAVLIAVLLGILLCGCAGSPQEEFRYYGSLSLFAEAIGRPFQIPSVLPEGYLLTNLRTADHAEMEYSDGKHLLRLCIGKKKDPLGKLSFGAEKKAVLCGGYSVFCSTDGEDTVAFWEQETLWYTLYGGTEETACFLVGKMKDYSAEADIENRLRPETDYPDLSVLQEATGLLLPAPEALAGYTAVRFYSIGKLVACTEYTDGETTLTLLGATGINAQYPTGAQSYRSYPFAEGDDGAMAGIGIAYGADGQPLAPSEAVWNANLGMRLIADPALPPDAMVALAREFAQAGREEGS